MRRKLFGIIGGAVTLAGTAAGALTAERKRRDARFYRDLMTDLQVVAGVFRGRREACAHEEATPEAALSIMTKAEEFDLVQGGLYVDVDVCLPKNMDVTRLEVTFFGSAHTLFMLRKRLVASQDPRLALEEVGTIDSEPNGSQLKFTLLLPGMSDDMAHSVQKKLTGNSES